MSAPPAEPGVEIKRPLCTLADTAEREAQLRDVREAAPRGVSFLATQRPQTLTAEERAKIQDSLAQVRAPLPESPPVEFRTPTPAEVEEIKATLAKHPFPPPQAGGTLPSPARVPQGWGPETAALRERVAALEAELAAVTARVRELEQP